MIRWFTSHCHVFGKSGTSIILCPGCIYRVYVIVATVHFCHCCLQSPTTLPPILKVWAAPPPTCTAGKVISQHAQLTRNKKLISHVAKGSA